MNDRLETLVCRFLEDRESLSPDELRELEEALRENGGRVDELSRQLIMDDLLAQCLAADRKGFIAQVRQRIADLSGGKLEESRCAVIQAVENPAPQVIVQSIWRPSTTWTTKERRRWAIGGAVAATVLAVALLCVYQIAVENGRIATLHLELGRPRILRRGISLDRVADGIPIYAGDTLICGDGVEAALEYPDGSSIHLRFDTRIDLAASPAGGKSMHMTEGVLMANIKPQASLSPMVISTPNARLEVLGTSFRLVVRSNRTRLSVSEGKVRMTSNRSRKEILVASAEFAELNGDTLATQPSLQEEQAKTIVLNAVADGSVNQHHPDQKFGTDSSLIVGGNKNGKPSYVAYVQFDVPVEGKIARASLHLEAASGAGEAELFVADDHWSEKDLTWRHHPSSKQSVSGSLRRVTKGETWTVDVTRYVGAGKIVSFGVRGRRGRVEFASRESKHGPRLRVQFE